MEKITSMDWLFEGRAIVFGSLICIWLGLLLIWIFAKYNHFPATTISVFILIILYFGLDKLVSTNKENAELVLSDISDLTLKGSVNSTLKHFDEQFKTARSTDLKGFKNWLATHQADKFIKNIIFWDIEDISQIVGAKTTKITCLVKVKTSLDGMREGIYRVEFIFQNNKDGLPTILSFQVYDPINQNNRIEIGI